MYESLEGRANQGDTLNEKEIKSLIKTLLMNYVYVYKSVPINCRRLQIPTLVYLLVRFN